MPKAKKITEKKPVKGAPQENTEETKEVMIDDENKDVDAELIPGESMEDDEDDENSLSLDEVDPFQDKYEE